MPQGTQLSPTEELAFQVWKAQHFPKDSGEDYDLRGLFKSGEPLDAMTGHGDDKFKYNNHPTYSTNSMYNTVLRPGGQWSKDATGKDVFTPSKENLRNYPPGQMKEYFAKEEPNSTLNIPGTYSVDFAKVLGDVGKFSMGNVGEKDYQDSNPDVDYKTPLRSPVMPIVYEGYNKPSTSGEMPAPKLTDSEVKNIAAVIETPTGTSQPLVPQGPLKPEFLPQTPDYGGFRSTLDKLRNPTTPPVEALPDPNSMSAEELSDMFHMDFTNPELWKTPAQQNLESQDDTVSPKVFDNTGMQEPGTTKSKAPTNWDLLFKDPTFSKRPLTEQLAVMARQDPDFATWSPNDLYEFRALTPYPLDESMKPSARERYGWIKDYAIDSIAPVVAAAIIRELPSTSPVGFAAKIGLSGAVYTGMMKMKDEDTPSLLAEKMGLTDNAIGRRVADFAQGVSLNEGGNVVFKYSPLGAISARAGEVIKGTVASIPGLFGLPKTGSKYLDELGASFGQYRMQSFGDRPWSAGIENVWNAVNKTRLQERQSAQGIAKMTKWAKNLSGMKDPTLNALADSLRIRADRGLINLKNQIEKDVLPIRAAAQSNPAKTLAPAPRVQTTPAPPQLTQALDPVTGKYVTQPRDIYGPIELHETTQAVQDYLQEMHRKYANLIPDDQTQNMIDSAQKVMDIVKPKLSASGQVIGVQPNDWEEVWDLVKVLGDAGHAESISGTLTRPEELSRKLYQAVGNDLYRGAGNWSSGGQQAQKAVGEALGNLNLKYSTFGHDQTKDGLRALVDNKSTVPIPQVDAIIDDPKMLQKALDANKFTTPTGTAIKSDDMQSDLQGYFIKRLLNRASVPDQINPKVTKISPDTIANEFKQFVNTPAGEKLFPNKRQRNDMGEYLYALATTQANPVNPAAVGSAQQTLSRNSVNVLLRWGLPALLTGGAAGAGLSGGDPTSAIVGGGVGVVGLGISAPVLARILMNQRLARVMINSAKGLPLGMSEEAYNRLLVSALNGQSVALTHRLKDGSTQESQVVFRDGVPVAK